MNHVKKVFTGMLALWLTACSSWYASHAEKSYLKARNGPELVIPAPLTASNLSYFYTLPIQNQNPKASVKPPTV